MQEVTKTSICKQALTMPAVMTPTVMTPTVTMPAVMMPAVTMPAVTTNKVFKRRTRNARKTIDQNNDGNSLMTGNVTVLATAGDATTTQKMNINTTKRTRKITKHGGVASKKVALKKIKSSETNTASDTNSISKYLMPVHNVQWVPLPKEGVPLCQQGNGQLNPDCNSACNERSDGLNDIDDNTDVVVELSEPQQQFIYSWSCTMFLKHFWVSQKIHEFEILMHFLSNTVKEGDMFVPSWLTWLDNIKQDYNNPDMYAVQILFMLLC